MLDLLQEYILFHILSILVTSRELASVGLTSKKFRNLVTAYQKQSIANVVKRNPLLRQVSTNKTAFISGMYSRTMEYSILCMGGVRYDRQCDLFNSFQRKFSRGRSTGIKRGCDSKAIFHKGLVFVVSGETIQPREVVEYFDTFRLLWNPLPSPPKRLAGVSIASALGKLYVIGGHDRSNGQRSDTMFELQEHLIYSEPPASSDSMWKQLGVTLLNPRSAHDSVCYRNQIWIAGGTISSHANITACKVASTVEVFNPVYGTVTLGPPLQRDRIDQTLLVANNNLYLYGIEVKGETTSIEKLNTELMQWEIVFSTPRIRRYECVAVDPNNRNQILIFGGDQPPTWDAFNVQTLSLTSSNNDSDLNNRSIPYRETMISALAVSLPW